tara:strand:+ start:724 stop:1548 length:825 start_codon:yes stop_codon:yes gene_type:complete
MRRELVDFLRVAYQVSIRRACEVLKANRGNYHYKSRKSEQAVLKAKIKDIARTRVRYGYRRIHTLLRRDGWVVNHKRVYRLYCEEGLQLRNKTPKRKVSAKLRKDRSAPKSMNDIWAMDFMSDQLFNGQRLRLLTIVDTFSKICPSIGVGYRYCATDVIDTLDQATKKYGFPKTIRVDNGPEFISKELDLWAYAHGVELDFSRPGKPTDNAFIEAFNSRCRQECLNTAWFLSLNDAKFKIEAWRMEYNTSRPHSAIGNIPPAEFAELSSQASLC